MCTDCNEITIPTGPKGDPGINGTNGVKGDTGLTGANGQNGTTILATYNNSTGVGTPASLVETTLFTYNVPANTLNANGDELEIFAYYSAIPSTNAVVRFKLGSQIFTVNEALNATVIYKIKICRINTTSQLWTIERIASGTATNIGVILSTVDLTTILACEITAQNTVATAGQIILYKSTLYKYTA